MNDVNELIDYDFWMLAIVIINLLITIGVGGYSFFKQRSAVTDHAIKEVHAKFDDKHEQAEKRHQSLHEKVIKLEARPTHKQEIIAIHERINNVAEGQQNLEGRFDETSQAVKRIHDYLITKGS